MIKFNKQFQINSVCKNDDLCRIKADYSVKKHNFRMSSRAISLVQRLQKIPENSKCADCLDSRPEWASSKLGIFICLNCSGIHRSLGTHISFVRSCKLDQWTDEQAAVMRAIGNKIANSYWEYNLPKNFVRPNSNNRAQMEAFIRRKYVDREFARPNAKPPNEIPISKLKGLTDAQIDALIEENARMEIESRQSGLDVDDSDLIDQIEFPTKSSQTTTSKDRIEITQSYGSKDEFSSKSLDNSLPIYPAKDRSEIIQSYGSKEEFSSKSANKNDFSNQSSDFAQIKPQKDRSEITQSYGSQNEFPQQKTEAKPENPQKDEDLSVKIKKGVQDVFNVLGDKFNSFRNYTTEQFLNFLDGKEKTNEEQPAEAPKLDPLTQEVDLGFEDDKADPEFDFLFDKQPKEQKKQQNKQSNEQSQQPKEQEKQQNKQLQQQSKQTKEPQKIESLNNTFDLGFDDDENNKDDEFNFLFEGKETKKQDDINDNNQKNDKSERPKNQKQESHSDDDENDFDQPKLEKVKTVEEDFDFLFDEKPVKITKQSKPAKEPKRSIQMKPAEDDDDFDSFFDTKQEKEKPKPKEQTPKKKETTQQELDFGFDEPNDNDKEFDFLFK